MSISVSISSMSDWSLLAELTPNDGMWNMVDRLWFVLREAVRQEWGRFGRYHRVGKIPFACGVGVVVADSGRP